VTDPRKTQFCGWLAPRQKRIRLLHVPLSTQDIVYNLDSLSEVPHLRADLETLAYVTQEPSLSHICHISLC
jgi:hypothetical protein